MYIYIYLPIVTCMFNVVKKIIKIKIKNKKERKKKKGREKIKRIKAIYY